MLEAQRRYTNMWWPGLEAKYARGLDPDKPCMIGCSYFLPWWRFYAVPEAENKVWIGQVVANGARPQFHHSGYRSEYYDRRGFGYARDFLKVIAENDDAYVGLTSQSRVALIYSRQSMDNFAGRDPENMYLNHFRGFYNALTDARIPFDVLSDKRVDAKILAKYDAVALPNLACLSDKAEQAFLEYVEGGGHVVATHKTGLFQEMGQARQSSRLIEICGGSYTGITLTGLNAAYGEVRDPSHHLLKGFEDTNVVPVGGSVSMIGGDARGNSPLTYIPPVETRPGSGISVPEHNRVEHRTDAPLILEGKHGTGSIVFLPWEPDLLAYRFGLPDHFTLLANALRAAPRWQDLVTVDGPGLIDVTVMGASDRVAVHLVNFSAPGSFNSGQRRIMKEIMPVHDLEMTVRMPEGRRSSSAKLVHAGRDITATEEDGIVKFTIPVLKEFETILLRLA